jgi:hypothetical protein
LEIVIKKVNKKKEVIIEKKKNEIVRLENEIVISEIVFGMVNERPYEGFQKIL